MHRKYSQAITLILLFADFLPCSFPSSIRSIEAEIAAATRWVVQFDRTLFSSWSSIITRFNSMTKSHCISTSLLLLILLLLILLLLLHLLIVIALVMIILIVLRFSAVVILLLWVLIFLLLLLSTISLLVIVISLIRSTLRLTIVKVGSTLLGR